MRPVFGILMAVACLGCGQPPPRAELSAMVDAGRDPSTSACALDTDCPAGMLCEGCDDGFFTCVPGCRTDAQCGANMICSQQVQCLTCPCPSGYCDLDPCRDLDGDGFAAADTGSCPGKQLGDCNDAQASVRPGGTERCINGLDDDCDGKRDANDDECRDSCPGSQFCNSSLNCGVPGARFCDRGCCEACPAVAQPQCSVGECLLPGGLDEKSCKRAGVCVVCMSCSTVSQPVCGKNFSTYDNACLAQLAGTTVLHDGDCDRGEGATCLGREDCQYNQFCRTFGTSQQCARVGTCSTDADCDFVTSVVSCGDAGVADWVCRNERCTASCP